uniref:Uncharacterized protein n=1 Tax=Arundo donax TaxID=35708 RepID=A0A0A9AFL2_ARUDO
MDLLWKCSINKLMQLCRLVQITVSLAEILLPAQILGTEGAILVTRFLILDPVSSTLKLSGKSHCRAPTGETAKTIVLFRRTNN